jgi:hypothetical protein
MRWNLRLYECVASGGYAAERMTPMVETTKYNQT